MTTHTPRNGFALLLTLITVTALISIGLAVLDLSIKQVRLSGVASDSEVAFSAANAGVECALYWRRLQSTAEAQEVGESFAAECFDQASVVVAANETIDNQQKIPLPDPNPNGEAYYYQYEFTWGSPARCSRVTMVVASSTESGASTNPLVFTNVADDLIPGYPAPNGQLECERGLQCTIISAEGFNKACSNITEYGTVQREVLLEL